MNRHTRKSSLARQTVMQPQAEEQSAHMSQVPWHGGQDQFAAITN